MTSKYVKTILLLYAITNEKTEIDADRQVDIRLQLQDLSRRNTIQYLYDSYTLS